MCEFIATVIGAIIAGLVGWFVSWWQRRRDGRDRFLAVVNEIEAQLDGCKGIDDRPQNVHTNSLTPLRSAIFAVQPFVSKSSFKRLVASWNSYKEAKADAFNAADKLAAHDLAGRDPESRPPYPDEMLRSYFEKFRREVG